MSGKYYFRLLYTQISLKNNSNNKNTTVVVGLRKEDRGWISLDEEL